MSIQIEVDEAILPAIDEIASDSQRSRYDVVNEILLKGLRKRTMEEKIRQFEESYKRFPLTDEEIKEQHEWEEIQDWGDE